MTNTNQINTTPSPQFPNKSFFVGELKFPETNDKIDYGVYNSSKTTYNSISAILDYVYQSDNKTIRVAIRNLTNNHVVNRMGILHRMNDNFGVESYHVGSFQLETELDGLVGEKLEIYLEHFNIVDAEDINYGTEKAAM